MRVAKASYANVLAYNRALWVDIKLNRGTGQVTNTHSHTHSHTLCEARYCLKAHKSNINNTNK